MSDQERDEFFAELEKDAGEAIAIYALGEIHDGLPNLREPLVGLFYATAGYFFFQTFPKKNWFTNILGGLRKKKEDQPFQIKIPLSAILSVELKKPKGFFEKIFSAPMPFITIRYDEGNGAAGSLRFSLLSREQEFSDWLSAAIKNKT